MKLSAALIGLELKLTDAITTVDWTTTTGLTTTTSNPTTTSTVTADPLNSDVLSNLVGIQDGFIDIHSKNDMYYTPEHLNHLASQVFAIL